ncbi:MAG: IS110 family RNA-guided transposase [Planctomycetota bacterium]|jgi:transposase
MEYIAFDSHKRYTLACVERPEEGEIRETRIEHDRGALRAFLGTCRRGSDVAVETVGNWYWIVDEIEEAEMTPRLVHARKAKLMMGMINKTDRLDARGLNRLQRNKTLPTVWIPSGELRDRRELPRTRMILVRQRTQLKNRIHATLAKYALAIQGVTDAFGKKGRAMIDERIRQLPPNTRYTVELLLEQLDDAGRKVKMFEERMSQEFSQIEETKLLMTVPGIGFILAVVIGSEVGDVSRFASAAHLASYAGTTPRVHSSGGRTRYGKLRSDVNRYLKWAFTEAANSICINRRHWPDWHMSRLYDRLKKHKGHQKAIGAVARHLAEATYWMLTKKEAYRNPNSKTHSSRGM